MGALRRHPTAADSVVAALFAVASFVSLHAWLKLVEGSGADYARPGDPGVVVAMLATTLPLALRRRSPRSVAVLVIGAFVFSRLTLPLEFGEPYVGIWACYLAIYSAVRYSPPSRSSVVVCLGVISVMAAEIAREILVGSALPPGLQLTRWFLFVYNLAVLALPAILGLTVRSAHERQRQLAAQAVELEREREENARRAVLEERVRIARELHDVVAHHVSVIGIQAGAARRVVDTQPEKVTEVLGTIESSSRDAVAELHRLLGFLRRTDQPDGIAPQPDLSQLGELVTKTRQGEMAVELVVEGQPRPLPATVELSAYRVIQEALTNVLKHSDATSATVRVDYSADVLEVEVTDDGRGSPHVRNTTNAGGNGLIGMRERVRLHGGHLRAGPGAAGGFAVRATFPFDGQMP